MAQTQRISKNNTTVQRDIVAGGIHVTLHQTRIVLITGSVVTLNTGGWNTVTTRTRMNQVANELCDGMFVVGTKEGQLSVSIGRATMARLNETGNPRPFPNIEFYRSITFDYMTGEIFAIYGETMSPMRVREILNAQD